MAVFLFYFFPRKTILGQVSATLDFRITNHQLHTQWHRGHSQPFLLTGLHSDLWWGNTAVTSALLQWLSPVTSWDQSKPGTVNSLLMRVSSSITLHNYYLFHTWPFQSDLSSFFFSSKTCHHQNFIFLLRWQTSDCTVCCPWCPDSGWCGLCGRTIFRWSRPQLRLSPKVTVALYFLNYPIVLEFGIEITSCQFLWVNNILPTCFFPLLFFSDGLCQLDMVHVLSTSLNLWRTWSDMSETKWTSQITQRQSKYGEKKVYIILQIKQFMFAHCRCTSVINMLDSYNMEHSVLCEISVSGRH